MTIAVVKKGETLSSIAKKYRVTPEALQEVNGLESSELVPGLSLYIPEAKIMNRTYIVKAGDTLSELARDFHSTVSSIRKANPGLSVKTLKIGKRIHIPSPYKKQMTTIGFAFPVSGGNVFETLEKHGDKLSYLAIVAYSFTEEGYVYVMGDDRPLLSKCAQTGVTPLLMLRNFLNGEFSAELAGMVLQDPIRRGNLIASLLNLIRTRGYGGVSMDLEFIPPDRRMDYVRLLEELKAQMGSLLLQVNVHAKTADNFNNRIVGGHDYEGIGKAADLTAVMTIDYGYPTGPPNPISPIWWMTEVIEYALSKMAPEKLLSAFPLYGYDWITPSYVTDALSALQAQNLAITKKVDIRFNKKAASPTFSYVQNGVNHIVWFEDIRSINEKYEVIDAYDLAGATYWQIGLLFPQNWAFIDQNILVRKS